jgi:hypothetical protein
LTKEKCLEGIRKICQTHPSQAHGHKCVNIFEPLYFEKRVLSLISLIGPPREVSLNPAIHEFRDLYSHGPEEGIPEAIMVKPKL